MNQESGNNKKINIFLIRGLTRESGHWGEFIPLIQENLPNAKIHLLDLPGAGVYAKNRASSRVHKMVDFIRKDVIESIENDAYNIICATSLAGIIAIEWTMRYPKDFKGLIMVSSSVGGICNSNERAHRSLRWDMFRILFTRNIELRERLVLKVNCNKPEIVEKLHGEWVKIQKLRPMTRLNIFRQTLAGIRYRTRGRKPDVPILIIGSKSDRLVSKNCIDKMNRYFGGDLIWHETSGHGIPLDEPKWLSERIASWCSDQYSKYVEEDE